MDRVLAVRDVVDLITDASSIINLANAGALDLVTALPNVTICVSPLVVGECEPTCAAELLAHRERGTIRFVDAEEIASELFLSLLDEHDLGEGETECLALLLNGHYSFCCDDGKARTVGIALTDVSQVTGSIRLLKRAVEAGLCAPEEAFQYYQRMKDAGGFLPDVPPEWFEP
jgi:predicted nucleic acid-binding protein